MGFINILLFCKHGFACIGGEIEDNKLELCISPKNYLVEVDNEIGLGESVSRMKLANNKSTFHIQQNWSPTLWGVSQVTCDPPSRI